MEKNDENLAFSSQIFHDKTLIYNVVLIVVKILNFNIIFTRSLYLMPIQVIRNIKR